MKKYFLVILVCFLITEVLLSQSQTAQGIGYGLTKDAAIEQAKREHHKNRDKDALRVILDCRYAYIEHKLPGNGLRSQFGEFCVFIIFSNCIKTQTFKINSFFTHISTMKKSLMLWIVS